MKLKKQIAISLAAVLILTTAGTFNQVQGQTESQQVNLTVQLSVCGNEIGEGGEDCDGTDLKGQSCEDLGYAGGTLSCTIACDFETDLCISPSPTPTPSATPTSTITPTPTVTPTPTSGPIIAEAGLSASSGTTAATATPTVVPSPESPIEPNLPSPLRLFDLRGIGRFLYEDLPTVVAMWVEEWRNMQEIENCDMNNDKRCDLKDFSILMFYVER